MTFNSNYVVVALPVQQVLNNAIVYQFESAANTKAFEDAVLASIGSSYGLQTLYVNITSVTIATASSLGAINADGSTAVPSIEISYTIIIQGPSYTSISASIKNISQSLQSNVASGAFTVNLKSSCAKKKCSLAGSSSSTLTVFPVTVVYVPKSMQTQSPSVAPTSATAGSQSSGNTGSGGSSNAGAVAGGAVAAVLVVAFAVSYYVWKKRSMINAEDEDDLETQKEEVQKTRKKDVEMNSAGKKKKKSKRPDRDDVVKHTIDEDSNLELFYEDQRVSAIAKSPFSHSGSPYSPRDLKSKSQNNSASSVTSPLPVDASIDQVYGTNRLTAQSLETFKSDRYAPNQKKDAKEFGVFEVSKRRPLSGSSDGGSVDSRQESTKSGREEKIAKDPENALKAIFDKVLRGETGIIAPDILLNNRKQYTGERSGSDSSLESNTDSMGKGSMHSLTDKKSESTARQVDTV